MASSIAIHTLELVAGADRQAFESLMTKEVFPEAAETPGSMNRGGQSAIESQHLLASDAADGTYLWIVKNSGQMGGMFSGIASRMYEEAHDRLACFVASHALTVLSVVGSFAVGPRDQLGRPTGLPRTGKEI
jgi:hypothetical protein